MNYIFDLDGTLIQDSDIVGKTLLEFSRNLLSQNEEAELNGDRYQRLKQKYAYHHYRRTQQYLDEGLIQLAPGVEKFLDETEGFVAGLTNSPYRSTETKLKTLGLEEKFDTVLTSRDVRRKPNPQGLNYIIQDSGLEPDSFVFIGNSVKDVLAGKRAGIKTVAIGKGFLKTFFADEAYISFQEFAESH